ncbi:prepilin peptidase [Clostridium tepidum]|jgi:leader peptidase (prepilin peptidase)/N-methyltransferase|uniref:Prepilin peptidase n=1 Tax=Clostridium tepidum TaxID=1962263 RepID=A0A1S9I3Z9_9CLOT|nr:A24 family peptidase [Clostridium tepidum]MCR1933327.1 prepilin peptidase [Clostridium tepidum]MDU6877488.1 prepilin peptidase [Clostridium botulinum]OOO62623.1 prepilin peptidase [Clostridium tepidum]OOO65061.1 prepilin peptidase [Clostridium tepidum]
MNIIVFIFGIIIGGFLNLCIYKIPKGESIIYPSFYCEKCGVSIQASNLISVIGYIFLKGKCKCCKNKIFLRNLLIELLVGVLFIYIYNIFGLSFNFIKYIIFISFIIVIGFIDLDTTNVYSKTTISAMTVAVICILIEKFYFGYNVKTYIYAVLLCSIIIGIIIFTTKGMGNGDLDIYLVVSLFLGFKITAMTIFLSFIFGSIIGIILIILKIKNRKDYISFGPFIAAASIICILIGDKIFLLYISFI